MKGASEMKAFYEKHINGNKTNIVVVSMVFLGLLHGTGLVVVPTSVWTILGGAGMACIRDALKKIEKTTKEE